MAAEDGAEWLTGDVFHHDPVVALTVGAQVIEIDEVLILQVQTLGDAGRLHVLDSGIKIFNVFADHDEINAAAAVGRLDSRKLAHRADIAIGLK